MSARGELFVQRTSTSTSAITPRRPARATPAAQRTSDGARTTAKYRVAHAGEICDAVHATTIVTITIAASAWTIRRARGSSRDVATIPMPPASANATSGPSPATTLPGASRSACSEGARDHGAPVWRTWSARVATHTP